MPTGDRFTNFLKPVSFVCLDAVYEKKRILYSLIHVYVVAGHFVSVYDFEEVEFV